MALEPCSVCQNPTSKYHCPFCRAPSCSLPCFKTHKSQCEQPTPKSDIPNPEVAPGKSEAASIEDTPLVDLLIGDHRLQNLFQQYPTLRAKLKFIFETTIADDREASQFTSQSPRGHKSQDTPQKRIARAMRLLERQLDSDTAETSGIMAFAELVAELGSRRSETDSNHANAPV
ncbi:hypothetical protein CLAIMM_13120 [Cladophialophora immunda]|nr:hypothetical protein CLAIMM_13120 [Cladophialophora immunda]